MPSAYKCCAVFHCIHSDLARSIAAILTAIGDVAVIAIQKSAAVIMMDNNAEIYMRSLPICTCSMIETKYAGPVQRQESVASWSFNITTTALLLVLHKCEKAVVLQLND